MKMKKVKNWCLYSDEKQTKLLAMAYEEDQIDFETQYYSEGCWFEYDVKTGKNGSSLLLNERKYNKAVIFPQNPFDRPKFGEDQYDTARAWADMKETMGTSDVR